ncbi:hypothetical protein ACIGZJ_21590 [Kitasatospora sp. NPDC052868]|uniref:hypothetical protein n=1 Tax=Kitasatospora sp. NPDC052868 TaxID=3364060 RepID=UPI0037CC83D7
MNRLLAILAGTAVLTAVGAAQATARPASETASSIPTRTCVSGYQGILLTELCADVDGDLITLTGHAAPASITWTERAVPFRLSASVAGGAELGTDTPSAVIPRGGRWVGRVSGAVPCGSTVEGTFLVTQWGWPPSTATISVPVPC